MYVKPGKHPDVKDALLKVRIPHTHELLPDEGREVPENQFWVRRLNCGDVVLADPPRPPAPEPSVPELASAAAEEPGAPGHEKPAPPAPESPDPGTPPPVHEEPAQ